MKKNNNNFALFIPSKLVYHGEKPQVTQLPAVEKLPDVPDRAEYTNAKNKLNERNEKSFKSIKSSKEYKELHKLDSTYTDVLVIQFKQESLGKGGSVSRQLRTIKDVDTRNDTPLKKKIAALKVVSQRFEKQKATFLKKLEAESARIKKVRGAAIKTFFTKTLPKKLVKEMVEIYSKKTGISQEAMKQAMDYGSKLAMVGVSKLMKELVYVTDAFTSEKKSDVIIIDEMNPKVKAHVDKVDIAVENLIEHEADRLDAMPGENKNSLLTYTRVGDTVRENAETRSANEKFIKDHVEKRIMAGLKVTINISGNTSAEGSAKVNKKLAESRANAKKTAMEHALTKVMGNKWKGKVEFKLTTQVVTPKVKMSDLPSGTKKKFETDKKYAYLKIGGNATLKDALKEINAMDNSAQKLSAMINLFLGGNVNSKAVLSEYNTYMRIKTNSKHQDAERWLATRSKYLKNNGDLLIFLHKNVGRARSAEVKVAPIKEKDRKVSKLVAHAEERNLKGADNLLYKMKDYKAALALYKEANAKNPTPQINYQMGVCYRHLKDNKKALQHFEKAYKLANKKGAKQTAYFLAKLNMQLDDFQPNEKKYARYYASGREKFNKGDYKEAIALLKKANEFDPKDDPSLLGYLATCYSRIGNRDRARHYYNNYKRRISKNKGYEKKYSNFIALIKNSVEGAENDYKQYRKLFREGIKKFDGGYYKEAIATFKKADAYHKTAKIHTRIALCYKWLGENGKALKHYKTFLKLAKKEKGFEDKPRNRALVARVKNTMIPQLEAA